MNNTDHSTVNGEALTETVSEIISANPGFGFHSIGSDGRFIQISQTELDWLGYKREEVVGKLTFYDLLTKQDKERFLKRFPVFQETGIARDVEYDWVSKDGTIVPISVNGVAVKNERGEFLNTATVVINLAQRKELESAARKVALLKQREELHSFLQHDLKSPLTSSDKMLDMMLAGGTGILTEQQKKILGDLKYTNSRILKKMNAMMNAQRSEERPHTDESNIVYSKEAFAQQLPLWKVIKGCVIRTAQSGDFIEKNLSFDLDLNSSSIIVDTHPFERLIGHLLEHAAKRSPDRGALGIACFREKKFFELKITDAGKDVPESMIGSLLCLTPGNMDSDMSGLNLFLCGRIVEAYGGDISIKNRDDRGGEVTVHIPM